MIGEDFRPGAEVGGQGIHSWRFRTVQDGKSEIRIVSRRSWETPAEPAQSFTLRVMVTTP
jgi:predicted secreted protein